MIKLFLSYAREDIESATILCDDLRRRDIDVWFDRDSLLPGQNWKREVKKAINNSHFFIALISKNTINKKGFVQKELKQALDILDEIPTSKIYIIPVRLDECILSDEKLKEIHLVDLFPSWSDGVLKILKATGYENEENKDFVKTKSLTIKNSYYFTSPYQYVYFIENGKLKKVRRLPPEVGTEDTFRDPIKIYFYNRSTKLITIDDVNLIINKYDKLPNRIVIGYLEKGVFDREIFHVCIDPNKKSVSILKNKYLKISPYDGENIIIDFDSNYSGLFDFHFSTKYFENEIERVDNSNSFQIFCINKDLLENVVYIHSFDDRLAEYILKSPSEAWNQIVKNRNLSINEIREIIKNAQDKIKTTDIGQATLLGIFSHKSKEYEDAIYFFNHYLELEPYDLDGYYRLADTYLEYGDFESSLTTLLKAKKLDSNRALTIEKIAKLYEKQENKETAIKYYHELSELIPHEAYAWFKLAENYSHISDTNNTLIYAEKAIKVDPFYSSAYFIQGICFLKTDNFDKAWNSILFTCLAKNMSDYVSGETQETDVVRKAIEFLNVLESHCESSNSADENILGNFIKKRKNELIKEDITKQFDSIYANMLLSWIRLENEKKINSIQLKEIEPIEKNNQLKCIVETERNMDVLSAKKIIKIKNISGTILKDIQIENIINYELINFTMDDKISLQPDQSHIVAGIKIGKILSFEQTEIQELINGNNGINPLSLVNSKIKNIAYETA